MFLYIKGRCKNMKKNATTKNMSIPKTRFSIAMPTELAKLTDEMAVSLGINRNALINLAITNFIENKKVTQSIESISNGMLEKFNTEFDKMLKQTKKNVDKASVK